MSKPDVNAKFMLVADIIGMVLDDLEIYGGTKEKEGHRRPYWVHTNVSQLDIIKKIEEVYCNE